MSSPAPSNASWSQLDNVYLEAIQASTDALAEEYRTLAYVSPAPSDDYIRSGRRVSTPALDILAAVAANAANLDSLDGPPNTPDRDFSVPVPTRDFWHTPPPPSYTPPFVFSPTPQATNYVADEDIEIFVLESPVLRAAVATVPSPAPTRPVTPALQYPVEDPAPAVQPAAAPVVAPVQEELLAEAFLPFSHLFLPPPCTLDLERHPHQHTVFWDRGEAHWCPQEELVCKDFLRLIPRVQDLVTQIAGWVTPFRHLIYHDALIQAVDVLPPVTICARVGRFPPSASFPFGYVESSFVDGIKHIFGQFPPYWLPYFEGSKVPLVAYDFLDGRGVTLFGHLHFEERGVFVTRRYHHREDLLATSPELFSFVATPRVPTNPLAHVTPPSEDLPL